MSKKNILNPDGTFVNLIKEVPVFDTPPKGNPICQCEVCGVDFEQYLIESQNRYTSFKKCLQHRNVKKGDNPVVDEGVIELTFDYTPHEAQKKIHASTARFRVINAGSRFGKDRATTMEGIMQFLACLNEDRSTDMIPAVYWWIVAPTERAAKQNWMELKRYFPKELVVDISNSGMMLQTVYGGLIEARSAYDPESLVGVGLDVVTITEAARIADLSIVWANLEQRLNSPGRGIDGKGGIGLINSSPRGRTCFHKMWTWGQPDHPDYDPDWESWTFTTWDNPAMAIKGEEIKMVRGRPVKYKDRQKRRLGVNRYNQDVLALFLAEETKCFPDFDKKCVRQVPEDIEITREEYIFRWKEPEQLGSYVVSYDPASINDYPAVFVIDESNGKLKRVYNLSGHGWTAQYNKLAQISQLFNYAPVAFSKTGHETIQENLEKLGIRCITFNEQGSNKENFVTHYEGVVERGEIQILEDGSELIDEVIRQHLDYARVKEGKGFKFTNVDEPHDDFVDCGYIAFQAISSPAEVLPYVGRIMSISK